MIEINLLPGSGKKSRGFGVSAGLSTAFSGVLGQIKDPFMIAAAASAVICAVVVGGLYANNKRVESGLRAQEETALKDSAQYAAVIFEKRRAEQRRDSVMKQVKLIEAIDNDRFIWPHILAELSKSVPAYTWVGELNFITPAQSPAAVVPPDSATLARATTAADSAAILTPRSDPTAPRAPLRFAVKGYTVDVQAMTRMIRDLEASPFISNVQLKESKSLMQGITTVSEFTLEAQYEVTDSTVVKRAAFVSASR